MSSPEAMYSGEIHIVACDAASGCEAACRISVRSPGPLPDLSGLASRIARDVHAMATLAPPRAPAALHEVNGRWVVVNGGKPVMIARLLGSKKFGACTVHGGMPTMLTRAVLGAWLRARGVPAASVGVTDRHLLGALKIALAERVTISGELIESLDSDVCLHESVVSALLLCFPQTASHLSFWRAGKLIIP